MIKRNKQLEREALRTLPKLYKRIEMEKKEEDEVEKAIKQSIEDAKKLEKIQSIEERELERAIKISEEEYRREQDLLRRANRKEGDYETTHKGLIKEKELEKGLLSMAGRIKNASERGAEVIISTKKISLSDTTRDEKKKNLAVAEKKEGNAKDNIDKLERNEKYRLNIEENQKKEQVITNNSGENEKNIVEIQKISGKGIDIQESISTKDEHSRLTAALSIREDNESERNEKTPFEKNKEILGENEREKIHLDKSKELAQKKETEEIKSVEEIKEEKLENKEIKEIKEIKEEKLENKEIKEEKLEESEEKNKDFIIKDLSPEIKGDKMKILIENTTTIEIKNETPEMIIKNSGNQDDQRLIKKIIHEEKEDSLAYKKSQPDKIKNSIKAKEDHSEFNMEKINNKDNKTELDDQTRKNFAKDDIKSERKTYSKDNSKPLFQEIDNFDEDFSDICPTLSQNTEKISKSKEKSKIQSNKKISEIKITKNNPENILKPISKIEDLVPSNKNPSNLRAAHDLNDLQVKESHQNISSHSASSQLKSIGPLNPLEIQDFESSSQSQSLKSTLVLNPLKEKAKVSFDPALLQKTSKESTKILQAPLSLPPLLEESIVIEEFGETLAERQARLKNQRDLLKQQKKLERQKAIEKYLAEGGPDLTSKVQPKLSQKEMEKRKNIISKLKAYNEL